MTLRILFVLLLSPSLATADARLQERLGLNDAVHLLQRVGIGAEPLLVDAIAPLTREAAVDLLVSEIQSQPAIAMPAWVNQPAPPYWARGDMSRENRRAFNRARDREMVDLRRWWVAEMIATKSPQTERLVLMWHNHFVSAYSGIDEESTSMARQNQMFRQLGLGNYRQLLQAIIRDAAMLNYLDNRSNKKRSPNENLARELLELFTLGEGNYDEYTVKEAARALTGYTVTLADDTSFALEPWHQDKGKKDLFGQTGEFDGDDLINIILQQHAAASHIARLFWRQYISEFDVNEAAIAELTMQFQQSDFELRDLLVATLHRPEFWAPDFRGHIVKSPVDLLLGSIRSTGYVPKRWDALPAQLARLGQTLFDPPNVAGWSGGADWVTPARLLNRQHALERLFRPAAMQRQAGVQGESAASMEDGVAMSGSMMMNEASTDNMANNRMGAATVENRLSIRVAAENYHGAPEVQLVLLHRETPVWRSALISLVAGHDTGQYGRLSATDLMPWETFSFELPATIDTFSEVEVHFLNDAAGDGGDRNLYVDWVNVQGRYFYARDGKQFSGCPPKDSDKAGNLYCKGRVSIPLKHDETQRNAAAPADQLVAAHAHTWWFQRLKKGADWRQLVIGMTDVRLDQRRWDTVTVAIVNSNELGPGIEISTQDCVRDCFEIWPECAWTNAADPTYRSLYFPLRRNAINAHLACHWDSLGSEDQRLVKSLLNVLPQLLDQVSTERRAQRRSQEFARWASAIDKLSRKIDSAYRVAGAAKKLVLTGENITAASEPQILSAPTVGGRSRGANALMLKTLLSRQRAQPVLLTVPPVLASTAVQDVTALMADPAYQVK